jgi:hypothetical protein
MFPDGFEIPLEKCGIPLVQARKICSGVVHELFNGYIVSRDMQYDLQAVMVRVHMVLGGVMPRTRLPRVSYEYLHELLRLRSMVDGLGADALLGMQLPLEYEQESNATDSLNLEQQLELSELLAHSAKRPSRRRRRRKARKAGADAAVEAEDCARDVETGEVTE